MGIVNLGALGHEYEILLLTLITPHGDRKPVSVALIRSGIRASLPLTGIVNVSDAATTAAQAHRSLPLMGIVNRRRGGEEPMRALLITPHGDRKHPAPLAQGRTPRPELITPHGDRKPHGAVAADAPGDVARLITPHGDRKLALPARRPCRARERTSHYPSWGSQTRAEHRVGRVGLPLITPHGDRKLPLPVVDDLAVHALRLITPHGDRKPCGSGRPRSTRPPRPHYPSWGS